MKKNIIVLLLISISVCCHAQVGVNTTNPNAQLDIRSSNQASPNATDGMLVPKVDVFPIGVNANQDAMLVYLTTAVGTDTPGFYYYNHATITWLPIGGSGAEKINDLLDGKSDDDGSNNGSSIFLGLGAGANDDSSDNRSIGIGLQALLNNTTGYANTALGNATMFNNIDGSDNTAFGYATLFNNIDGSDNLAIGSGALFDNISGTNNVAIGNSALANNTTGWQNTAIGTNALLSNTTGPWNLAVGYGALQNSVTGSQNTALGYVSLFNNISGSYNSAVGFNSLANNTDGNNNVANGHSALISNTGGDNNVGLGHYALRENTNGSNNVAIGSFASYSQAGAVWNVAIGTNALYSNTESVANIAIGHEALYSNTGNINNENVAIGHEALRNANASANIGIGSNAMINNTGIGANIAIGSNTLVNNEVGGNNVVIGHSAGNLNNGSNNIFLGSASGGSETGSNKLYIESSNANANNALIYGEFDNDLLRVNGNLEISGVTNLHRNVTTGVALRVNGDEALWYNGTYFSWGYGGTANYFADNVGIGITNPATRLHVSGGGDASLADGSGYVVIGNENGINIAMDNNEILGRNNGANSTLYIQTEGGFTSFGGNMYLNGTLLHSSDRRLKKDITNLSFGLDEVLKLRPVEYFWKNREQKQKSLGLIAQEVDEVISNIVQVGENKDKTLTVSYTELIPVLINAIQEQQHKIETIEASLESVKSLEARIEALEHDKSK